MSIQQGNSRGNCHYLVTRRNICLLLVTLKEKLLRRKNALTTKQMEKLTELDITLEDDQSDEVNKVLQTIEQKCSKELASILKEADAHSANTGKSIRSSWDQEKTKSKAQFFKD